MRRAGLVVAETLAAVRARVAPGVTTGDLNDVAVDTIRALGATPNFLNYHGFPGVICVSVNNEVVHGIPGRRVLQDGDIVSIDGGAIVDGWHSDSAITVPVGTISAEQTRLIEVTEQTLWHGIAAARLGGRIGDISRAIEDYVTSQGDFGIAEGFTGHGIGSELHQAPDVPNFGKPGRGPKIVEGLVIACEPMVTLGTDRTYTLEDGWTAVTGDGSHAAHFEHTFTVTSSGISVLSAVDSGAAALAPFGRTIDRLD